MSKEDLAVIDEQKQKRAETARQNGRRSRGPVTPSGKYRSSLNSITTGKHLKVLEAELPEFVAVLTTDDIQAYLNLFQKHVRQIQPHSECELTLVRQIASELFQYQRLVTLETVAQQHDLDEVLRKYPDIEENLQLFQAYRAGMINDKVNRAIQRDKKAKLAAYQSFMRALKQLRKDFPMVPPEPVSVTPDTKVEDSILPTPGAVAEILAIADRAKSEPSFTPPQFIIELIANEPFMAKIAPNYDPGDLLERFLPKPVPEAA